VLLVALPLCGCLCELWVMMHRAQPSVALVETAIGWWFDCRAHHACLTSDVLGAFGSINKAAGQSEIASKKTTEMIDDVRPRVVLILDHTADDLNKAGALLDSARSLVDGMSKDAHALLVTANGAAGNAGDAVKRLAVLIDRIDALTLQLQGELKEGSQKAAQTARELNDALDTLNKLLADPGVAKTLAHVEGATGHLEESAKSVDMAMRPWREKAHLLKTIVQKAYEIGLHAISLAR